MKLRRRKLSVPVSHLPCCRLLAIWSNAGGKVSTTPFVCGRNSQLRATEVELMPCSDSCESGDKRRSVNHSALSRPGESRHDRRRNSYFTQTRQGRSGREFMSSSCAKPVHRSECFNDSASAFKRWLRRSGLTSSMTG